jgi:hypothetical protein
MEGYQDHAPPIRECGDFKKEGGMNQEKMTQDEIKGMLEPCERCIHLKTGKDIRAMAEEDRRGFTGPKTASGNENFYCWLNAGLLTGKSGVDDTQQKIYINCPGKAYPAKTFYPDDEKELWGVKIKDTLWGSIVPNQTGGKQFSDQNDFKWFNSRQSAVGGMLEHSNPGWARKGIPVRVTADGKEMPLYYKNLTDNPLILQYQKPEKEETMSEEKPAAKVITFDDLYKLHKEGKISAGFFKDHKIGPGFEISVEDSGIFQRPQDRPRL